MKDTLEQKAEILVQRMNQRGLTLAVAESCTGGLIASSLTSVAGASGVFGFGFVTYSNQAKIDLLNVDAGLIKRFGAVSDPVAHAMAEGAIQRSGADFALAVTGIAGPDGGTTHKPVGLVFIALSKAVIATKAKMATPAAVVVHQYQFSGTREVIRNHSAATALDLIFQAI